MRAGRRLGLAALLLLGTAGLGGCWIGIGGTWSDDAPPDVSLAVSPGSAYPGTTLELAASATDDGYVDFVEFFRMSGGGAVYLGSDSQRPYGLRTVLPDTADTSVAYFARAVDSSGQSSDSDWVRVTVLR